MPPGVKMRRPQAQIPRQHGCQPYVASRIPAARRHASRRAWDRTGGCRYTGVASSPGQKTRDANVRCRTLGCNAAYAAGGLCVYVFGWNEYSVHRGRSGCFGGRCGPWACGGLHRQDRRRRWRAQDSLEPRQARRAAGGDARLHFLPRVCPPARAHARRDQGELRGTEGHARRGKGRSRGRGRDRRVLRRAQRLLGKNIAMRRCRARRAGVGRASAPLTPRDFHGNGTPSRRSMLG